MTDSMDPRYDGRAGSSYADGTDVIPPMPAEKEDDIATIHDNLEVSPIEAYEKHMDKHFERRQAEIDATLPP